MKNVAIFLTFFIILVPIVDAVPLVEIFVDENGSTQSSLLSPVSSAARRRGWTPLLAASSTKGGAGEISWRGCGAGARHLAGQQSLGNRLHKIALRLQ